MATGKQIEANRLNAQKSPCPTAGVPSGSGKGAVRLNSLRHGMRACAVVLLNENEEHFPQLCDELEAEWQPQTPTEMALLEKKALAQWKFRERFERGFFPALRAPVKLKIRRQTAAAPPAKEALSVPTPEPQPPQPPKDAPDLTYVMSAGTPAPGAAASLHNRLVRITQQGKQCD